MEVEKRETQSQPQSQSWQMLPVVLQTQDVWLHSWSLCRKPGYLPLGPGHDSDD